MEDEVVNELVSQVSNQVTDSVEEENDMEINPNHQEIPENSGSLLVDETTSRFSGAIWYNAIQKKIITLAGVGGIGRFGNLINF